MRSNQKHEPKAPVRGAPVDSAEYEGKLYSTGDVYSVAGRTAIIETITPVVVSPRNSRPATTLEILLNTGEKIYPASLEKGLKI